MANRYYSELKEVPVKATLPTPPPGTKGVKDPAPSFTPVTEEPKKGI